MEPKPLGKPECAEIISYHIGDKGEELYYTESQVSAAVAWLKSREIIHGTKALICKVCHRLSFMGEHSWMYSDDGQERERVCTCIDCLIDDAFPIAKEERKDAN